MSLGFVLCVNGAFVVFGQAGDSGAKLQAADGAVNSAFNGVLEAERAANLREIALECGTLPVIPYPKNQSKGVRGILGVDRKFRRHGPQKFKTVYKKRVAVERVFSRLKNLASFTQHNLRRLVKVTFHSQLCIIAMLLTAQAAVNTNKLSKSRSIRYFAN